MDRVPLWIKLLAVVASVASVLSGLSARTSARVPVPTSAPAIQVLDPFADVATTVAALHRRHVRADCLLRAGVWEPERPDAARFDATLLGAAAEAGRWLDIRRLGQLVPIVDDRLALCVAKRFDGVSFDALDGYRHISGFPLTEADQTRFNDQVAALARRRGLRVDGAAG